MAVTAWPAAAARCATDQAATVPHSRLTPTRAARIQCSIPGIVAGRNRAPGRACQRFGLDPVAGRG